MIKNFGNNIIAITGNPDSFLAIESDFLLNSYVDKEACPNNLAPTTSTTAQLVMGDALAIALLEFRGFSSQDFAKFHPGGALGKNYISEFMICWSKIKNRKSILMIPLKTLFLRYRLKDWGLQQW